MGLQRRLLLHGTDRQPPAIANSGHETMLKLRTIGIEDYSVFEDRQRIGRIRLAGSASRRSGSGPSMST